MMLCSRLEVVSCTAIILNARRVNSLLYFPLVFGSGVEGAGRGLGRDMPSKPVTGNLEGMCAV